MNLRTTVGTALAAAASLLAVGAGPATAAPHTAQAAATAHRTPAVEHARFVGGYKTVKGVRYYHFKHYVPGTSLAGQPDIAGTISPDKTGKTIKFYWQVHYRGAWVNLTKPAVTNFKLHRGSSFDIAFHGLKPGYTARVAVVFPGDAKNSATKLVWHYYHVTK